MSRYSEEDLELLSDEERAALEEEDLEDDPEPDTPEDDDQEDAGADTGKDGEDGEDEPAAEPETPQVEDPAPTPDDPDDPSDDTQDAPPSAPVAEIKAAQDKIDELKEQKKQILNDYSDGEIDDDQLQAKLDEVMDGIASASAELGALRTQQQDVEREWFNSVNTHLKAYPEIKANEAFFEAMDAQVQAMTSQPAYANMPFDKVLKVAHSAVAATADDLGLKGFPALRVDPGKSPPPPRAEQQKPATKQNAGLGKTPETLRDIPAAAATDPDESEAAELEKLGPEEFEAAWATMPEDKRERLRRYM